MAQGVFRDEVHAKNSYEKLKTEKQPKSAQAMWDAWIAKVDGYVDALHNGEEPGEK